ncbi:putative wall-associated receptor kinase-like 16 [Panicum miliaceum]|uniref:Wall-associated receptor kinase-like 16 n=1 Tax=Panicum miliaceum TaxID=4540 RepID=A0A3L6S316_PANMI|nr:putative wall-associated receptor kinase-like 16 [Panicum miliaceum]
MYYYYLKNSADTVPILLLLLFSLTVTLQFQAKTVALPGSSCLKRCGDVDIVYPFGIGTGCAMKGFELSCNKKDGRNITMVFGEIPVLNILLLNGQVRIMKHISTMYSLSRKKVEYEYWGQDLSNTPFTYSGESNKFTVVGINTLAYISDDTVSRLYVHGCVSRCSPYNNLTAQDGECSGAGCCQVTLTKDMSNDYVRFDWQYNTTDFYTNRSTRDRAEYQGYATIMESNTFRFNTAYLNTRALSNEHDGRVPAILNWVVGNQTCDVASKKSDSYACLSTNSKCINSSSGSGYLCNCTKGYQGNPYLPDGCQGQYCKYTFRLMRINTIKNTSKEYIIQHFMS